MAHYAPKTGYEATLVDNLVDIQWQINQQCEMRNTLLRDEINTAIIKAVVDQEYNVWDDQIDTERDAWIEAGNDEDDFEHEDFDHQGAPKNAASHWPVGWFRQTPTREPGPRRKWKNWA